LEKRIKFSVILKETKVEKEIYSIDLKKNKKIKWKE
jgi:hypothetical protein